VSSEANMWKYMREHLDPKVWPGMERHEDKLGLGVADVSFTCIGRHGWMELKYAHAWPKREATVLKLDHFTPHQRLWLRRKGEAGSNTWLMLNVGGSLQDWLLFHWSHLDIVGNRPRADLYKWAHLHMRGFDANRLYQAIAATVR
jgi:hypothetical protein